MLCAVSDANIKAEQDEESKMIKKDQQHLELLKETLAEAATALDRIAAARQRYVKSFAKIATEEFISRNTKTDVSILTTMTADLVDNLNLAIRSIERITALIEED